MWFHRWVGIVMCLMFATWFATGAVMVFVAFPSLSAAERDAKSEVIDWARVRLSPASAQGILGQAGDLRLVSFDGIPAYVSKAKSGRMLAISAETGQPVAAVSREAAARIAGRFQGGPVAGTTGPIDYDQWIVHQQYDPWRPFYRVRFGDRSGTEAYVSVRTGEVRLTTRRFDRGWTWLGSVIHWMYFVPIRRVFALWDWTVWVISLVGLSTVVAGIWLGVTRTTTKMQSKRPALSPFRGLLRWHHVIGLFAGTFILCWIVSGWLSMDHGRLFSEGEAPQVSASAYAGGSSPAPARGFGVEDLRRLGPSSAVEFQRVAGHEVAAAHGSGLRRVLIGGDAGATLAERVPASLILSAARAGWPMDHVESVTPIAVDSAYAKAESLPASAVQIKLAGPRPVRLFVDGISGKILVAMDPSREAYAWVYYMLHTYNFPGLSSRPVLRITLLLIPLSLGFVFAVSGVLVGVRRLRGMRPAASQSRPVRTAT